MLRLVALNARAVRNAPRRALSSAATTETTSNETAKPMSSEPAVGLPKKMRPQDRPKKLPWFYAVRKGREVGVFKDWETAKGKILGFKGAIFKPFRDADKAKRWLELDLSQIAAKDLPAPRKAIDEKAVQPSKYVLNFGTVLSTVESAKGAIGMGWILRKFPEKTLIVAGCDQFNVAEWRRSNPVKPGYTPQLPRELLLLEALNRGLDEVKRVFKFDEAMQAQVSSEAGAKSKVRKLPFPLEVHCDHAFTTGLLSGANATIPELVAPLKSAKVKISQIVAQSKVLEVPNTSNNMAQGLARAALARSNPLCVIEGGNHVPSYTDLLYIIHSTPDVPAGVAPVSPPHYKPLEVNGAKVQVMKSQKA